ncbi:putative surface protein with fasciclin (FAS1) repeats [Filimonas zeae]|nr:fasciclin domain-containing protein [Filimonas zeae]MDR6339846.1 putative surface protein with fasciclin (FAS1) repeats [Filimonas zeae]
MRYTIKAAAFAVWMPALLVLLQLGACTKKDIMPEAVGEPVPYKDTAIRTWKEMMDKPGYTLWKAAWNRSDMNTLAAADKAGAFVTVFMPTDQAFTAAGWTLDVINNAGKETLDSLLSYHIAPGKYNPANIAGIRGSVQLKTLLTNDVVMGHNSSQPYIYSLYTGYLNDSLVINGVRAAKWGKGQDAGEGYVYTTDVVLQKPMQTMWEYIESNPEFSLFKSAVEKSDFEYSMGWSGMNSQMYLMGMPGFEYTLFLPSNKAFALLGIYTDEDVQNYINRSLPVKDPDYDENWFYVNPTTSMDSILMAHGLDAYLYGGSINYPVSAAYFSNDLVQNAAGLSGVEIRPGVQYSSAPGVINVDFSVANGQPQVKRHKANHTPMPLAQSDIRVLNGVIHVVDGLFIP